MPGRRLGAIVRGLSSRFEHDEREMAGLKWTRQPARTRGATNRVSSGGVMTNPQSTSLVGADCWPDVRPCQPRALDLLSLCTRFLATATGHPILCVALTPQPRGGIREKDSVIRCVAAGSVRPVASAPAVAGERSAVPLESNRPYSLAFQADRAGLENRYGLSVHRGFESPPLRYVMSRDMCLR